MGYWQLCSIDIFLKTSLLTFYNLSFGTINFFHCITCIHAGRDKLHLYDFHLWFTFWNIVKNAVVHICFCKLEHIGMSTFCLCYCNLSISKKVKEISFILRDRIHCDVNFSFIINDIGNIFLCSEKVKKNIMHICAQIYIYVAYICSTR